MAPKQTLVYSHKEYVTTKKALAANKNAKNLFFNIQPAITKNSPIKALVPGNPEFASKKNKKKPENMGIVVLIPE